MFWYYCHNKRFNCGHGKLRKVMKKVIESHWILKFSKSTNPVAGSYKPNFWHFLTPGYEWCIDWSWLKGFENISPIPISTFFLHSQSLNPSPSDLNPIYPGQQKFQSQLPFYSYMYRTLLYHFIFIELEQTFKANNAVFLKQASNRWSFITYVLLIV